MAFLKVSAIVLIANLVLMPLANWLGPSWWLAGPILALNWPAMPMAVIYSVFLPDNISQWDGTVLLATEALISSVVWGFIMSKHVERKLAAAPRAFGFPVIQLKDGVKLPQENKQSEE
jgi:hypothetical protein